MKKILLAAAIVAGASIALIAGHAPTSRAQSDVPENAQIAIFAGGCFWCVESDFDHVPGVLETISGYTGGHLENPTYRDVVSETTGHREVVRIAFDPSKVSYMELLAVFWRSVDPTDAGGQFCDRGESYTTAIYTLNAQQQKAAEASAKTVMDELGQQIVTVIEAASTFYPAEDYHQDFYLKNPLRYRYYRFGCRRDARIEALWGEQAHRGIVK